MSAPHVIKNVIDWNRQAAKRALKHGRKRDAERFEGNIFVLRPLHDLKALREQGHLV